MERDVNLRAGKLHDRRIAPRDRHARARGDSGIVNGVSDMHVERDGNERRFSVRYLAVYENAGGAWRMIAGPSTRMPD